MCEKKIFMEGVTVDDLKSVFNSVCIKTGSAKSVPVLKASLSYDENLIDEFAKNILWIFFLFLQ